MPEINILEIKNIIRLVKEKYGFDPGIIVPAALLLRIKNLMSEQNINNTELLFERLEGDPDFYPRFLYSLFSSDSELLRDPEMWIHLKDQVIPGLSAEYKQLKIHVGFCSSGSELFSTKILVNETGLDKQAKLHYSWPSEINRTNIKEGKLDNKQLETSLENLKTVFPCIDEKKYLVKKQKEYFFNNRYLKDITDDNYDFNAHYRFRDYHLIIFRNRLLNFNPSYQNLIIDNLVKSLEKNGILVLGFKENINDYLDNHQDLVPENEEERIYKKLFNG